MTDAEMARRRPGEQVDVQVRRVRRQFGAQPTLRLSLIGARYLWLGLIRARRPSPAVRAGAQAPVPRRVAPVFRVGEAPQLARHVRW
jgi:hypothetical protein